MSAETMLAKRVWAVIGVSRNPNKYSNMIYHKLKKNNYTVYAVNPTISDVDGDPVYPSLSALPEKPDVINMVVAPAHGAAYLENAAELGVTDVWFQPGTHDDNIQELADRLGLQTVQGCVLVASRQPFKAG